jgi:large subunit ribosomal protein L4
VHILEAGQLNTYDVLVSDDVVFTKDAFDRFTGNGADGTEGSDA